MQRPCCEAPLKESALLLQKAAEAKAYMQYVAFESATHRYVPVVLTDGNIMVMYVHNTKLNAHQRIYWGFDQILAASVYLAELVKQIALNNPLMRGYIPGHDDQPESPQDLGTGRKGPNAGPDEPSMDHEESKQNDSDNPLTKAGSKHGISRTAGSMPLKQQCLTDMQDADMQDALRLARFHPCVTAVYGLPPYAKPTSYGLAS